MKNKSVQILLILMLGLCCVGRGDDILPCRVVRNTPVIDGDPGDPAWQNIPFLTDTKTFRGDITMSLKSLYDLNKLYLLLAIHCPDNNGEPDAEIFLRPAIHGHSVKNLDGTPKEYFSIKFNSKGLISTDYNSKVELKTKKNPAGGYWLEAALDMPNTFEYLPQVPVVGDYYNIAVRFKYPIAVQRYPMYFFTNHFNQLGPNMAKIILAGDQENMPASQFFDYHVTYRQLLNDLTGHIAELRLFKQTGAADQIAGQFENWKKVNASLSAADYEERRLFQQEALTQIVNAAKSARFKALAALPQFKKSGILLFAMPCWDDSTLLNNFNLPEKKLIDRQAIQLRVSPGEAESFSAAIWPGKNLTNVTFEVPPFKNAAGQAVGAVIDHYYLKCWYQGKGYTEVTRSETVLMPELLVKNPDLVQVDYLNERNLLQVYHNGKVYRSYPDDSKTLLPIRHLPAGFLQQFWTRIKFPAGTAPGTYRTTIRTMQNGTVIAELPVSVEVLDIKLAKSPIANRIYAMTQWGAKDEAVAMAEIRSLVEHEVDTVGLYEKAEHLPRVVDMMKKGGLSVERIYLQGDGDFIFLSDMPREAIAPMVEKGLKLKEIEGVKDVYFYLPDEAKGERLKKSVEIAEIIHRLGGKTWGAAHLGWYEWAGKSFNHINISGPPKSRELVNQIHADGNEIHVYNFPQGGLEFPERYRRNFGIMLWASGYDGSMTWSWWWPYQGAENDAWNEFNEHFGKQHCMVYPTKTGVVSTIQFEGWTKGINDTRYLGTLLELRGKQPANSKVVAEIDQLVKELQKDIYTSTNKLDELRERIIDLILKCKR